MAKKLKNKLEGSVGKPVPVKIVSEATTSTDKDREMKYRAEDALRDLQRAEGHKKDKELMKHVKKMAREKKSELDKFC